MALLGGVAYDPSTAVSKATTSLLAMTAIDTTNLRITFTAPSNGAVLVRIKGQTHGATTFPRILLGVLESSTLRGRVSPIGAPATALATTQMGQEATYVISGLTSGNSYTFDAAYGVEITVASTGLKYGGPNNTTTNDNWGAFNFEIWETPTLLYGTLYDPTTAVTKTTTSLLAMTAIDTTNLRATFNAPSSGRVLWRINGQAHGATVPGQLMLGVLESSTVRGRSAPIVGNATDSRAATGTTLATSAVSMESSGVITGLTPGNSYTFDAAYGVDIVAGGGGFKYGGPNDTTTDNAFGGIAYEIWAA